MKNLFFGILCSALICAQNNCPQPDDYLSAHCDPIEQAIIHQDIGLLMYVLTAHYTPLHEPNYYIRLATREVEHLSSSATLLADAGSMALGLATVCANNPQQLYLSYRFLLKNGFPNSTNTKLPLTVYGGLLSPCGILSGLYLMYKGYTDYTAHQTAYKKAVLIQKIITKL